eukprot:m.7383 g.7383  ORF g.7383 m.7383 type:complete len:262 (+) comp18522_c0_seq1:45-830(+)
MERHDLSKININEKEAMARNERVYVPVWLFAFYELASVLPTALCIFWFWHYRGGFAWDSSSLHFNWHPVLTVTGFIYFASQSMLTFRLLPCSRPLKKAVHVILHVSSAGCAAFGIAAVFVVHQKEGYPHLYSLHSWCGLITAILFTAQFSVGFFAFLFPGARMDHRLFLLPIHSKVGLYVLGLAAATSLIGINEMMQFGLGNHAPKLLGNKTATYKDKTPETFVANFLGLAIVGVSFLVFYIVTRGKYKASSQQKGEMLLP